MNFQQAIASVLRNYVNFSGRAARSEFWYWQLFMLLGGIVVGWMDHAMGYRISAFGTLFSFATLIPDIAVSVRRLHDIDSSGWWLLAMFIPLAGIVVLIVWWCTKGSHGYNRFGPDPLPAEISPHGAGRSLHRGQIDRAN